MTKISLFLQPQNGLIKQPLVLISNMWPLFQCPLGMTKHALLCMNTLEHTCGLPSRAWPLPHLVSPAPASRWLAWEVPQAPPPKEIMHEFNLHVNTNNTRIQLLKDIIMNILTKYKSHNNDYLCAVHTVHMYISAGHECLAEWRE